MNKSRKNNMTLSSDKAKEWAEKLKKLPKLKRGYGQRVVDGLNKATKK